MPTTLEPVAVDLKWTWVVPSPGQITLTAVGVPGPAFNGPGDKNYFVDIPVAAVTWTVVHNFGKYPSVVTLDSTGRLIEGDVLHFSVNTLQITFSAATAGKLSLN